MSLFGRQRRDFAGATGADLIPARTPVRSGAVTVTENTALRHSAVWACLRLRADLLSTFPVDVYRRLGQIQIEMPKPPILVNPGGERWDYCDWMYASQFDLDRTGNTIGLITEVNALGLPARVDLQPIAMCSVVQRKGQPEPIYRIDGKEYTPDKVWHEKQYPVAGLPVGLSPIAYAASSIGEYLSIVDFALSWFAGGAVPKARLRNNAKTVKSDEADKVKARYRSSVSNGDIFVTGMDWEFDFIQAQNAGMEWIEGKRFGISDIARYFGCPGDLIEGAVSSGSITYANITQRNLQFLIMNLGPVVYRREKNLSKLLPRPRYVKLNTDALLRMDPETRERVIRSKVESRRMTVTEARELDNMPPLTPEQEAEFGRLFPQKQAPSPSARASWWEQVSPTSAAPYTYPVEVEP